MNKLELFGRYLKVGLSAISFLAEKDAASIPNAGYSISDIFSPSAVRTFLASSSSESSQLRSPLSLWPSLEIELGLSPYIILANNDRFINGLASIKSFGFIGAKVKNKIIAKISTQMFVHVHNIMYFSGVIRWNSLQHNPYNNNPVKEASSTIANFMGLLVFNLYAL